MKNLRTVGILVLIVLIIWIIKFVFNFPTADIKIIGTILSIASILFGLLTGFFISELWSRYTEIRTLQGERASSGVSMIKMAGNFFTNKKFEKDFKKRVEKSAIADEVINWDEGHLEECYYQDISTSYKYIKVNSQKDAVIFDKLIDSVRQHTQTTMKMNILYKEKLFFTEWFILIVLSVVIVLSVLFLDTIHFLYQTMILVFPIIVYLALKIIYRLDKLTWARELITLEPTQVIFDNLDVKRFYLKRDLKFVSSHIKSKGFRTEDDLKGEMKKVYTDILAKRKLEKDRK